MASVFESDADHLVNVLLNASIDDQGEGEMNRESGIRKEKTLIGDGTIEKEGERCGLIDGICAICLDKIVLQETALIKDCEHAYCVVCILRWATYSKKPTCPQCKHPFDFLNIHRSLDGSIQDYMFEESVCLLLRAPWFKPLAVEDHEDVYNEMEDYYPYEYEEEDDDVDPDEVYLSRTQNLRIGNRRWGDNGYVRAGRQEARPARTNYQDPGAGSSGEPKKKEPAIDKTGRRAKRTLKREAADRAAAAKHQQHLVRLGRK